MAHFAVIGGGIAGLSVAYHLVRNKQGVTVFEENTVGSGVSSVAAGMVTPASEVHLGEDQSLRCLKASLAYYPNFIDELTDKRPRAVDFRRTGSLLCAHEHDGKEELERLVQFQREMGFAVNELSPQELKDMEPYLSTRVTVAYHAVNEACVDNKKLLHFLANTLRNLGCEIIEGKKVFFNKEKNSVTNLIIGDHGGESYKADAYVLTTGLGADTILNLPLRGVKGEIITIQAPVDVLRRPVRVYHRYRVYLVPRADGRIVIGASCEEKSDRELKAGAVMDLIYAAWQALPLVYECPLVATEVGLRPTTPDHKPIVGKTATDNLFVLNGLYRHGIMASPYLARELVNLILANPTELDWSAFSLARFHG